MDKPAIGIVGCAGRMGRLMAELILARDDCRLAGGTERPGSEPVGQDLGTLAGGPPIGTVVGDDPAALFAASDVVLDFTSPGASVAHVELAANAGCAHLIGTTGLDRDALAAIRKAAERTAILQAANTSLGVNLLLALVEQAAAKLSESYDIEVLEMHHRHKVDAPSGTALALGEAAARGRGVALQDKADWARHGQTGARESGQIGFAVLRGGDVAGDHSVIFAAEGERVELGHRASSRAVFAQGAVAAGLWLAGKPAGLYAMRDVLEL